MTIVRKLISPCLLAVGLAALPALAKLPALSPDAKAKADEAAAKAAWSGKVDAYQLCQAQDRVAAKVRASEAAAGKTAGAIPATPACADPGAFVAVAAVPKPVEASGAHSPAPGPAVSSATTPPPAAATPVAPKAQ